MKYLCNNCAQGHLNALRTGCLTGMQQQKFIRNHTFGNKGKEVNGVFLETGLDNYELRCRQIGQSGIVEIEEGGGNNAYLSFSEPIGTLEFFGVQSGVSWNGKAVLIHHATNVHCFPFTGEVVQCFDCATCGRIIHTSARSDGFLAHEPKVAASCKI